MAASALPPPASGPESSRGLLAEVLSFFASFGEHLQALIALAGLEAKEASVLYLKLVVAAVAALVLVVFGYFLFIFFAVFLIAWLLPQVAFFWICLGVAVLHFGGAAACALYLRGNFRSPVFTETTKELKKDFDSLKNLPR